MLILRLAFFSSSSSFRVKFHIVESVLHMFTVGIGYILMLIVMTYNTYLFITVVVALTAGFLFLGPLRSMKAPHKVPARHRSLTDTEQRPLTCTESESHPSLVESAESSRNPYDKGLYDWSKPRISSLKEHGHNSFCKRHFHNWKILKSIGYFWKGTKANTRATDAILCVFPGLLKTSHMPHSGLDWWLIIIESILHRIENFIESILYCVQDCTYFFSVIDANSELHVV